MLHNIRRLTGANFLMSSTGAAAEADIADADKAVTMALWRAQTRALLDAVGWGDETIAMRAFDGGATLQISAPMDALYAATEVVEASWAATQAILSGEASDDLSTTAQALTDKIKAERKPAEVALAQEAERRGITYLGHDGAVSLGLGKGSRSYDPDALPDISDVPWDDLHDIPVAMVTGTNGKSTTVRLAAAIGAAAGRCVGLSSSDWVKVDGEILDEGDYSGPAGARLAVRDPRVDLAIIETARGGLMRRGLPVPQAEACLLTNIAADHLGTYGITDVPALADAKFQLADAVRPGGRLVLNADDPELVARAARFGGDITWFTLDMPSQTRDVWIAQGGRIAFVQDGQMMLARDKAAVPVLAVNDFAPGMKGAAKYNIANALGAIGLADALGLSVEAMASGLAGFTDSPDENPGRGNFIEIGGITLLIDFAHNPHGILALAEAVREVPAKRRLFLAGQAGDRSDQDTRDMTRAIWQARPDAVVIKELPKKLRGREMGELPAVISDELQQLGASPDQILMADDEYRAARAALGWAQPGDMLVLLLHEDRKPVMDLIDRLRATDWQAGSGKLPD